MVGLLLQHLTDKIKRQKRIYYLRDRLLTYEEAFVVEEADGEEVKPKIVGKKTADEAATSIRPIEKNHIHYRT